VVKVLVNGQETKTMTVDHEKPRWKIMEVDLAKWKGQEVTLRLEHGVRLLAWHHAGVSVVVRNCAANPL
jgi:hypothetical protein